MAAAQKAAVTEQGLRSEVVSLQEALQRAHATRYSAHHLHSIGVLRTLTQFYSSHCAWASQKQGVCVDNQSQRPSIVVHLRGLTTRSSAVLITAEV